MLIASPRVALFLWIVATVLCLVAATVTALLLTTHDPSGPARAGHHSSVTK